MNLEQTKTSFLGLSLKALLIIGGILSASGTTIYIGITTYNRVIAATEAVEGYKPYDDAELKNQINDLKVQLSAQQQSVNTVKDSMVATSNQLVAVSDKSSQARGDALEAKAIANGNARETQAALQGVREEVKATREGLDAQLKALKRATSNPLGQ